MAFQLLPLTRSPEARRHALVWFFLAVLALVILPVTFCATGNYALSARLGIAGCSGAAIGMLLYGILHAMGRGAPNETRGTD